ncbi:hypothetical protein CL656_04240 [bacterium]|nr:hypothetical protein [bacterium]|tara:strand:+ start:953 stop:1216 length:264 start_codon:yes stop_codon:yes gene_type:complete
MKKVYSLSESKKVKILAREIIQDLQENLLSFLNTQEEKYLLKINKHHQELKDLNLKIINPITGEISIPIIKNGTKKDHKWSLVKKKK